MNTVVPWCGDVQKSVISENRNTSVKLGSASPQKSSASPKNCSIHLKIVA